MKNTEIELPSNKKFGLFFSLIFTLIAGYFYFSETWHAVYSSSLVALLFFLVTVIKADALLTLNKLWMKFGVCLGLIVSPIVLGLIFFGLFTPIAILMRLSGRDELRLRVINKPSHWILRDEPIKTEYFKYQF